MTSAVDRWGMAEALQNAGTEQVFGDLFYALDLPVIIKRWSSLKLLVRVLTPLVAQLPFSVLYPTGEKQDETPKVNPEGRTALQLGRHHRRRLAVRAASTCRPTCAASGSSPTPPRPPTSTCAASAASSCWSPRRRGSTAARSAPTSSRRRWSRSTARTGELSPERYRELLDSVGFEPDVLWLQNADSTTAVALTRDSGGAPCRPRTREQFAYSRRRVFRQVVCSERGHGRAILMRVQASA